MGNPREPPWRAEACAGESLAVNCPLPWCWSGKGLSICRWRASCGDAGLSVRNLILSEGGVQLASHTHALQQPAYAKLACTAFCCLHLPEKKASLIIHTLTAKRKRARLGHDPRHHRRHRRPLRPPRHLDFLLLHFWLPGRRRTDSASCGRRTGP